jgi:hypothetical protein
VIFGPLITQPQKVNPISSLRAAFCPFGHRGVATRRSGERSLCRQTSQRATARESGWRVFSAYEPASAACAAATTASVVTPNSL